MFHHTLAAKIAITLAALMTYSVMAKDLPPDNDRQLSASGATGLSCTQDSSGRWRIIGNLVNSNNTLACGLALASGRCVFTCGPGSPRCEGGSDSLPLGGFDLFNLPTEPDGTIILQTFVSGNIPGRQVINPSSCAGGGGGGQTARWTAYNGTCCSTGTVTFSVTIDGVTKISNVTACGASGTIEPFQSTPAGTKNVSTRVATSCNDNGSAFNGTFEFSPGACYRIERHIVNGGGVIRREQVNCPSSVGTSQPMQSQIVDFVKINEEYQEDHSGSSNASRENEALP